MPYPIHLASALFFVFTMSVSMWLSVNSYAQLPDSVQAKALKAFHGPDGEGKDGPLSKVGLDLALLYYEYQAHTAAGKTPVSFVSQNVRVPVDSGYVAIDATATGTADPLRRQLNALGLKNSAAAGRVVSGLVPVDSIFRVAALPSLQLARPARAATNMDSASSHSQPDSALINLSDSDPASRKLLWYTGIGFFAGVITAIAVMVLKNMQ